MAKRNNFVLARIRRRRVERLPKGKNDTTGSHAEDLLIRRLKEKISGEKKPKKLHLKILINNSPCISCADKIINLIDNFKCHLTIAIHFAGLYNENENKIGLYKLHAKEQVTIQTFTYETWTELASQTGQSMSSTKYMHKNEKGQSRKSTDEKMRNKLKDIIDAMRNELVS